MYYVHFNEKEYYFSTLENAEKFVNGYNYEIHEVEADDEVGVLMNVCSVSIVIQTGSFSTYNYKELVKGTRETTVEKRLGLLIVNVCTNDNQEAVRVAMEKWEEFLKTITLKDINSYDYLE